MKYPLSQAQIRVIGIQVCSQLIYSKGSVFIADVN